MNCLLARRLVERGVRFVQLFHEAWDHHSEVAKGSQRSAKQTDQAAAALIKDFKRRGLLEDTIVDWGGEFGRTPMVESNPDAGRSLGRDHHNRAFSLWLAGGGVKPGVTYGETDEFGFNVAERPRACPRPARDHPASARIRSHETDLPFPGRDFRLTDVHGAVIEKLLG